MHLLQQMTWHAWFHFMGSVDLRGMRGKRKKYKIKKKLPTFWLEPATLRFVGRPSNRLSWPGWMRALLLSDLYSYMNFRYQYMHWYKIEAWWSWDYFVLYMYMYHIALHTERHTYWTNSKETQKSSVCYQEAKHDQTFYLIPYASQSNLYIYVGLFYKGHFERRAFIKPG